MITWLGLLLALPTGVQDPVAFEVTQELLDDAVARARPLVEEALGAPIPEGFGGARVTDPEELERFLREENEPIMLAQLEDEELAESEARTFSRMLAPALLAKYAMKERLVLVCPEGLERNAEMLGMPELLSTDVVRAIVVHELVHAHDVHVHGFLERCASLADAQRIQTLNAVLEGHAQHIARGVCERLGLADSLAIYDRAISAPAKNEGDEGEGLRLMRQVQREAFAALYTDGERFVAAVLEARGRDGIAEAFREPPVDMAALQEPAWYLNPELRPKVRFDLEASLALFEREYEPREWQVARQTMTSRMIATAFASQDEAIVSRIRASLRGGLIMQQIAPGGAAMHYILACEWSTPADAKLVVEASRQILQEKDEAMKEGAIRIVEAAYEDVVLAEDGPRGVLSIKRMEVQGTELPVQTLVLQQGALSFELVRSGDVGEKDDFLDLARRLVAAARVPAPREEPSKEKPGPAPEDGTSEGGSG